MNELGRERVSRRINPSSIGQNDEIANQRLSIQKRMVLLVVASLIAVIAPVSWFVHQHKFAQESRQFLF